uniref:U2 n=1 Tax=Human betaherpesvirus 6 TaxID=10368 RepID=A0A5P9SSG7_9BETA|nr:hypothetical protein [Human betaherpesvirus 6]
MCSQFCGRSVLFHFRGRRREYVDSTLFVSNSCSVLNVIVDVYVRLPVTLPLSFFFILLILSRIPHRKKMFCRSPFLGISSWSLASAALCPSSCSFSAGRDLRCDAAVPEVKWTAFVRTLVARPLSADDVRDFVSTFAHCRLALSWPVGAELRFATSDMLGITQAELAKLSRGYGCCPGMDLTVIGVTIFAEVSALVLVGECGEIYAFNGVFDDALYRLAEDAFGLWKHGLRRFEPVYGSKCLMETGASFFGGMSGVDDALAFAVSFDKALVPLPWPRGAFFEFAVPRRAEKRWRLIPGGGVAVVIGRFFGRGVTLPLLRRQRVLMDQVGRVYAVSLDGGAVVRLSDSFRAFLAMGVRKLFKNHRFPPGHLWTMQLPVTCVHAPVINLPAVYQLSPHMVEREMSAVSCGASTVVRRDCEDTLRDGDAGVDTS